MSVFGDIPIDYVPVYRVHLCRIEECVVVTVEAMLTC